MKYNAYCIAVPALENMPFNLFEESKYPYKFFSHPERYSSDPKNVHHWTTKYVWDHVLPVLDDDMQLHIDKSDYSFITNVTTLGDYSYHQSNDRSEYKYIDYENGVQKEGPLDILRMGANEPMWSDYHRLYRGAHRVSSIERINKVIGKQLLIIGDSMTVPVIPLLAPLFDKIICLDARANKTIPDLIDWHKISNVMCMFTTMGWFTKHLWYGYGMPYLSK